MNSIFDNYKIRSEEANYFSNGIEAKGFIAYDENRKGKLPVVIIVHEWWGLTDYAKTRAIQIAELGYFAFAADLFGNGLIAANPQEAASYAKPFYADPLITKPAVEAAIQKSLSYPQADGMQIVAMGYCFGGYVVVNAIKLGVPLKGVVSFHGRLTGVKPEEGKISGEILICQAGDDRLVPEGDRIAFKTSMDAVHAPYTFIEYPGASHAFTNPDATALGEKFNMPIAYDAKADAASWNEMKTFFEKLLK